MPSMVENEKRKDFTTLVRLFLTHSLITNLD